MANELTRAVAAPLRVLWLVGCCAVAGCTTSQVELPYAGKGMSGTSPQQAVVNVGVFTDQRKHAANWLGAIRGGYGNPLKTLETPIPVSQVVRNAFVDGLAARGLLSKKDDAPLTLFGAVEQFDCNQVGRREAHARIQVTVVDNRRSEQLFSQVFSRDTVTGSMITLDAGVFASVDDLRQVAATTLNEVVDEALDSSQFLRAVSEATTQSPAVSSSSPPAPSTDETVVNPS